MANHKHVEILSRGVPIWNQWREQDIDIKPNLSGTNLFQVNLSNANLRQTDLRKTDLRGAKLNEANLYKSDLRNANLKGASVISSNLHGVNLSGAQLITTDLSRTDLRSADMRGVRLDGADLYEADLQDANLSDANLPKTHLLSANLMHANLRGCNLAHAVLVIARLAGADLSLADLTGAKLYGTEREDWKIDGIKCEYAYWDGPGKQRTPPERDFKPGEFEYLYRRSPTIEFHFQNGFKPLQAILMDRVVKVINSRSPEFELHLDSLNFSGMPRAIFSVLHREDCPRALALIEEHYQEQLRSPDIDEVQQSINRWENRARV